MGKAFTIQFFQGIRDRRDLIRMEEAADDCIAFSPVAADIGTGTGRLGNKARPQCPHENSPRPGVEEYSNLLKFE
jgi:hypothetical protein